MLAVHCRCATMPILGVPSLCISPVCSCMFHLKFCDWTHKQQLLMLMLHSSHCCSLGFLLSWGGLNASTTAL
jgi:hypothetical protein